MVRVRRRKMIKIPFAQYLKILNQLGEAFGAMIEDVKNTNARLQADLTEMQAR